MNLKNILFITISAGFVFSQNSSPLCAMDKQQPNIQRDMDGNTELHVACQKGQLYIAEAILNEQGLHADFVFERNNNEQTAMMSLLESECDQETKGAIADVLLKYAGKRAYIFIAILNDKKKLTAWRYVIQKGDVAMARKFIDMASQRRPKRDWDLITKQEADSEHMSLHCASSMGHTDLVRYLLEVAGSKAKEFASIKDAAGQTAFDLCNGQDGREEIKKMLEEVAR